MLKNTLFRCARFIAPLLVVAAILTILKLGHSPASSQESNPQTHLLSPLALEGRDIFIEQGCLHCHTHRARNLSITTAGLFFAPTKKSILTSALSMSKPELKAYLGQTHANKDASSVESDQVTPSKNTAHHRPSYDFLQTKSISGILTQAKLSSGHSPQTKQTLIHASAEVAGLSALDALTAYLQASAQLTQMPSTPTPSSPERFLPK